MDKSFRQQKASFKTLYNGEKTGFVEGQSYCLVSDSFRRSWLELVNGKSEDQELVRLDTKDLVCSKHRDLFFNPNAKVDREGGQVWLVPEREYFGLVDM